MRDFRKLLVWRKAHDLALAVRLASSRFPRGYASQKDQMLRSAESIACNIVEGCGARTRKDFVKFLGFSLRSAKELDYQLQLARDCGVFPNYVHDPLASEANQVGRMLYRLQQKVLSDTADP
jgi:four helix bundle protein